MPLSYASGFSGAMPFTGMAIDTISGEITFVAGPTGSIVTAVEVREFDGPTMIRTVMRDFTFIVTNCTNTPPAPGTGTFVSADGVATMTGDRTLRACGAGAFCATMAFSDVDAAQALALTSSIAAQLPGATLTTTGSNPVQALLCWNSTGLAPGVYPFSIRAMDDACPIPASGLYHYAIQVDVTPSAGTNATTQVCENASNDVPLITVLGGTPASGGSWTDPQNMASTGVFMAGASSAGDYTYSVTGPTGCTAHSVVSVALLPPSAPECLNAGTSEHTLNALRVTVDGHADRIRIIGTSDQQLDLRLFALDGRELWNGPALLNNGSTTVDLRGDVHGPSILRASDRRTGHTRAFRVVLP
jgi:hypothetical protein